MVLPLLRVAVRSPFSGAGGVLAGWHPVDLTALIINEALNRSGLEPVDIDQVWVGCDEPVGAQGANLGRAAVVAAGWAETVPASVVEANPTSGMAALLAGWQAIASGRARHVLVAGVGSGSTVTPGASALNRAYGRPWGELPGVRYQADGGLLPPVMVADREATQQGLGREDSDRWASDSVARRWANPEPGLWLVPVGAQPGPEVAVQRGQPVTADALVAESQQPRDATGVFEPEGVTTAASLAATADGVVALVLSAEAETAVGELLVVDLGAGSLRSTTEAAKNVLSRCRIGADVPVPQRWEVAEASASTALVAAGVLAETTGGLSSAAVINPDGATLAVGDAGAAEDLRLVVDGMARSAPGTVGGALRSSAGAAGACVWRRR